MKPIRLFSLTVLALPACTTTPHFDAADANGDRRVTREESLNYIVRAQVREYDSNRNGGVEFAEYSARNPSAVRKKFNARDLDGNGSISVAEGIANGRRLKTYDALFNEIDANRDGAIDRREAEAYAKRLGPYPGE